MQVPIARSRGIYLVTRKSGFKIRNKGIQYVAFIETNLLA